MQEIHEVIAAENINKIFPPTEKDCAKRARAAARRIRDVCQTMDDSPPWRFALITAIALEGYADALDNM